MDQHYSITIAWSVEDGCWLADAPDLRTCTSHGDTPEGALANIRIAIEGWIETALADGRTLPEPQFHRRARS